MAKISALPTLTAPAAGDLFPIVDISDTTGAASGTTKKLALAGLDSFISGLKPKGAYNAATTYAANDVVTQSDMSLWVARRETTGNAPAEGADWTRLNNPAPSTPSVTNITRSVGNITGVSAFSYFQRYSGLTVANLPAKTAITGADELEYLIPIISRANGRANDVITLGAPFFVQSNLFLQFELAAGETIPAGSLFFCRPRGRHWTQTAANNAPFRDTDVENSIDPIQGIVVGNRILFDLASLTSDAVVDDTPANRVTNNAPIDYGLDVHVFMTNAQGTAVDIPTLTPVAGTNNVLTKGSTISFFQFADSIIAYAGDYADNTKYNRGIFVTHTTGEGGAKEVWVVQAANGLPSNNRSAPGGENTDWLRVSGRDGAQGASGIFTKQNIIDNASMADFISTNAEALWANTRGATDKPTGSGDDGLLVSYTILPTNNGQDSAIQVYTDIQHADRLQYIRERSDGVWSAWKRQTLTNAEITKLNDLRQNVQADWDETDTTSDAYIRNKPTITGGGGSGASVLDSWDMSQSYPINQLVIHNGVTYRAKVAVPANTAITSTTHWAVFAPVAANIGSDAYSQVNNPNDITEILANILATIKAIVGSPYKTVIIGGDQFTQKDLPVLEKSRDYWQAELVKALRFSDDNPIKPVIWRG